jgi:hypothetical protein
MQAISAIATHFSESVASRAEILPMDAGEFPPALSGRIAPAATRTRRSRPTERYYVGRRPRDTEVYIVTATEVARLQHPGYQTGTAVIALWLLTDFSEGDGSHDAPPRDGSRSRRRRAAGWLRAWVRRR